MNVVELEKSKASDKKTHGSIWEGRTGEYYLLAMVDYNRYQAIGFSDGNRWGSVGSIEEVTKDLIFVGEKAKISIKII